MKRHGDGNGSDLTSEKRLKLPGRADGGCRGRSVGRWVSPCFRDLIDEAKSPSRTFLGGAAASTASLESARRPCRQRAPYLGARADPDGHHDVGQVTVRGDVETVPHHREQQLVGGAVRWDADIVGR